MLLCQVYNIELHRHVLRHVPHVEKEPLVVALRIYIVLKNQIVFVELSLIDSEQIPRLEAGIEFYLTPEGYWGRAWPICIIFSLIFYFLFNDSFGIQNVCSKSL